MLALVYLLFVTKHKLFVPAMSIVTHTQLTGNTSLLCSPIQKETLPGYQHAGKASGIQRETLCNENLDAFSGWLMV